jgi:hypothetical protein
MTVFVGDRVRMTGVMPNDPDPLPVGLEGTVTGTYPAVNQIHVKWDEDDRGRSRSLILLYDDPFEVVPQRD